MNRFVRASSTAAACALAFVPMLALATVAHAETIRVGDLSQPAAVARFNSDVKAAATNLCRTHVRTNDGLARVAACHAAVRSEAVSQLSAGQRSQLKVS
jgi:UrcA family protein